mgnify:CR=1 FL=1
MRIPISAATFNIVLVDEDYSTLRLLDLTISRSWGHRTESYRTASAYLAQASDAPDVLLYGLPPELENPAASLRSLQRRFPGMPIILLCSREDHDRAAALLTKGAWDYFTRPVDLLRLRAVLQRIADVRQLLERIAELEERLAGLEERLAGQRSGDVPKSGVRRGARKSAAEEAGAILTMDEAKETAIRRALRASGGNVKEAARLLGIGRTTIYKLMEKFNLHHRSDDTD